MSITPRMRDCRFSSVSPGGRSPSARARTERMRRARPRWGRCEGRCRGARASAAASVTDPLLEYREGMDRPWTCPAPRASTAMAATSEESTPPDRPITASVKPFLPR